MSKNPLKKQFPAEILNYTRRAGNLYVVDFKLRFYRNFLEIFSIFVIFF